MYNHHYAFNSIAQPHVEECEEMNIQDYLKEQDEDTLEEIQQLS